ncbi:MAG: DUF3899 domain-containing protein [Clostridia bacterium]|jgi:hypothetical protein|nr:DUF3899 domain-containing protein [Clostridia bacterium]
MKKLKYFITLLCGFAASMLIFLVKDIFSQTEAVNVFHILCDGFFAVGVVITAMGLLIFTSNEGTFDAIVYGVGSFIDMFRRTSKRKYETLYDYRESRSEKKVKFGFLLICGLFFILLAMVMYLFYRKYS